MLQLFVSNCFFLLLEHNNTVCTISDLFGDFFFVWLSLVYHFRTSYALMSQWMMQLGNRSKAPVEGYVSQPNFPTKHSAGNVYGRRSRMVNSDGAPSPYNPDAAQLAAVRSLEHHSTEHRAHDSWWKLSILKTGFFFLLSLLDGRIHSSTPSILHKQRIRRLPQILPASQPAVPKQTLPSIWSTKVSLFDPLSLIVSGV